jgi:hypothetical protein
MGLPIAAIDQFKRIYHEEFGETLATDQANLKANKVFNFFKTITEEITKLEQEGGVNNGNKTQSKSV